MKFSLTFFFLFIISFSTLSAQEAKPQLEKVVEKTVETKPIANSLLWAISGNGLADTSYLYGTIHLIAKDDFFLTDQTKTAFDKSQKVTFEINMEDMSDLSVQMGLMMKAFMADGQTLSDLLDAEKYKEVKDHFAKMGMNDFMWQMMEKIKPMFLSVFGSMDMSGGGGLNTGEMMSYEMEFMDMAKSKEKIMGGLETAGYQMSMFVYKNQDIKGMMKMFAADEEGVGQYEDLLLVGRNKNWIPVMQKMMTNQITFFAVGAGHLGGDNGVVNLLKAEGYTLTPLNTRTL